MKKIISLLAAAVMLFALMTAACADENEEINDYSELFERDDVIEVSISIDEADLEDMRAYPLNEEYHSADITFNGVTIENAGIRTKGNMTLTSIASSGSDRYSYRVKFNKYVKGQKLYGLNELVLNSGYSDPSYMREYLHYEYLRELGMNVPETVFCNLYINGEHVGLYLAIEAIDSSFVETEFGDSGESGNLYKMEQGARLQYREDESYSYAELKYGTDTEMTGLKSFIKALNDMPEGEKGDIEKYLDVDSALKYIASNTVLSNYDSYSGVMGHNYYLYESKDGILSVIPWDFNMSFGGMGADTTIGIDTPVSGVSMDSVPLIKNLLAVDEYKERYYGYIEELTELLSSFEERVNELKSIIEPYVENDPTSFYTIEEFENATTAGADAAAPEESSEPAEDREGRNEEMRPGGGGPGGGFGSSVSIIDIVNDRLENIAAQFDGTADKETSSGGFGGGGFMGGMPPGGGEMSAPPDGTAPTDGQSEGTDALPEGGPQNGEDIPGMPGGGFGGNMAQGGERPELPPGMDIGDFGDFGDFGNFGNSSTKSSVIRVHIDGHIQQFDVDPIIDNDTTLVEYRTVMESLGAEVTWDEASQTVTAVKGDTEIKLTIGSETAYVNGEAQTLLCAPQIIDGHTLVPIRFIAEQFGMKVKWDEASNLITVSSR